jgi:hypothetical protein
MCFTGEHGNAFEYEIVTHCEYIGRSAAAMTTESHCDLDGLSRVQNAGAQTGILRAGSSARTPEKSMMEAFMQSAYRNRKLIMEAARVGVRYFAQPTARGRLT